MADNKLLLKRDADQDFLDGDDPLAELARIAGFEPEPAPKVAAPQRREPAFDLEDELLKELEIYAQPAAYDGGNTVVPAFEPSVVPQQPAPQAFAPAVEPVATFEPVLVEPAQSAHPLLEAVETYADASEGRVFERPASHPVFDLEDEILREFAAFDARPLTAHEDHPVEAEIVRQDMSGLLDIQDELHDAPDVRTPIAAAVEGREIYESFRLDELDAEISRAAEPELDGMASSVMDERPNFSAVEAQPVHDDRVEPVFDLAADPAPSAVSEPIPSLEPDFSEAVLDDMVDVLANHVEDEEHVDTPVAASFVPHDVDAAPNVVPADTVMPSVAEPRDLPVAQSRGSADYGLDDLLAEVEKYPVGDAGDRWGVQSKPVDAEDVARSAAPMVHDFSAIEPPAIEPVAAAIPEAVSVVAPAVVAASVAAPAVAAANEPEIAFDESLLEIDLGDIDLDLSELRDADFEDAPAATPEISGWEPAKLTPAVEPVAVAPPRAEADYSSLPFDPSQIAQEEDVVEAIAEMDVPDVPVVHEEERPVVHPEYDLDLDAEMAHLFATSTGSPVASQRSGQDNVVAFEPAVPKTQGGALDLDEFERALEEDFRRSLTDNRSAPPPDRVALAPVQDIGASKGGRRGWLLLSTAAVAILVFGGAGVYAFMSGDTAILSSSEPKIILADTEPVKIVPEEPGGKQVPNQNKAVYDRVSGTQPDQLKQESLVSSNEEPIDVVQRTLEPENLPMDDDAMAMSTPTGDTVDPRLLPDEGEQERVTTTSKVVSGVSPRKVKTMVVKPDGTLVEREVTEEDLKQQAANDAELQKIAQKAAQDAATASDSQSDDIAKAIDSVPERLAPTEAAADDKSSRVADTASDTSTKPVEIADVDPIDAAKVNDQPAVVEKVEPVVAEKPVEEAVQAVEKTELKPVETVQEPTQVERSIAVDNQDSVADQTAVADQDAAAVADPKPVQETAAAATENTDAAVEDAPVRKVKTTKIAPVPEVRPVDQPVTVVGTVTDQGAVQSQTEAKPQEVASVAQKTETPVEATPVPAGSYVIQIASLPSEAEAQTSYSRLSSKFAGIIGGRGVDIRRAEIKNKGTYYRVRIPAGSKQEAQALCSQYKAAGGSCLVSK